MVGSAEVVGLALVVTTAVEVTAWVVVIGEVAVGAEVSAVVALEHADTATTSRTVARSWLGQRRTIDPQ
ncbi:MAG TPA: hypothetical protein VFD97_02565 [Acidimicrobiia bacterium]|nr:hypothetical protein [Acidimicrobiia bacterium]